MVTCTRMYTYLVYCLLLKMLSQELKHTDKELIPTQISVIYYKEKFRIRKFVWEHFLLSIQFYIWTRILYIRCVHVWVFFIKTLRYLFDLIPQNKKEKKKYFKLLTDKNFLTPIFLKTIYKFMILITFKSLNFFESPNYQN